MLYKGWILDFVVDFIQGQLIIWFQTEKGSTRRLPVNYHPPLHVFIVNHHQWTDLNFLARSLEQHPNIVSTTPVNRYRSIYSTKKTPVLELRVESVKYHRKVAKDLQRLGGLSVHHGDINVDQLFCYETGLFPFCHAKLDHHGDQLRHVQVLDRREDVDYLLPSLRVIRLSLDLKSRHTIPLLDDTITALDLEVQPAKDLTTDQVSETICLDGDDEAGILTQLQSLIQDPKLDPDILVTTGGDDTLFPFLIAKAQMYGFQGIHLSRDEGLLKAPGGLTKKAPSTYTSYGIIYSRSPNAVFLSGRLHVDTESTFAYNDARLDGTIEISRLTRVPLQRSSRITIGQAMTSIQIYEAWRNHLLIPVAKLNAERFKTAADLLTVDRGGFLFTPRLGIHEDVAECDFSSMYPNIMRNFNISPETVQCTCCDNTPNNQIPFTPFHACTKRQGIIPQSLDLLLSKRNQYKALINDQPMPSNASGGRSVPVTKRQKTIFNRRQRAIKWVLVTCLAADTWIPLKLENKLYVKQIGSLIDELVGNKTGIIPCSYPLQIYSIDKNRQVCTASVNKLLKVEGPSTLLQLHLEDERILTVTADHPSYVFRANDLQIQPAANLKEGDALPIVTNLNGETSASIRTLIYNPSDQASGFTNNDSPNQSSWGDLQRAKIQWIDIIPNPSPYVYCFQVDNVLPAFIAGVGGIFTHNCFGYLGFKNSRFGRAEAHNATTAYSREMILQAARYAEQSGHDVIHGIVDSLWLRKKNSTDSEYEAFCARISDHLGVPFEFQGVYQWIVFLPSRENSDLPVLNRYYGLKRDGTFKLRGIELRRRDTPAYIRHAQEAMLNELAKAKSISEWHAKVPEVYQIVQDYIERLWQQDVDPHDLVFKRRLSRELDAYQAVTYQAAAAHHLRDQGIPVYPGQNVRYVIVNASASNPLKRVIPLQLIDHVPVRPDPSKYEEFLIRAFENILPPSMTGFNANDNVNFELTEFI